MSVTFQDLNLPASILRAVQAMGFEYATPIQAQSIPLIQTGCDVIGRSQTGTGKTVAFGIPALQAIDPEFQPGKGCAQVLILCPTRELAMQACEELKKLAFYLQGIRIADVYGGAPMEGQIVRLKRANLVVGTPGRVMDHMRRRTLRLDFLKMIVLDEADEMLSMGFREDIETILQSTPDSRQTILFSATMPQSILNLTRTYQRDPQMVAIQQKQATVERIEQFYYEAPKGYKLDALNLLLRYHAPQRTILFCNTKKMVEEVTEYLTKHHFQAQGIHGDLRQSQRTQVMNAFKSGSTAILVATDVAARGIDVNDIDYVINYDIPQNAEYYIHRIGRTGRAGKSGTALTLCCGRRQVSDLLQIAKSTKSTLVQKMLPTIQEIREQSFQKLHDELSNVLQEPGDLPYLPLVQTLQQEGIPMETLCAHLMQVLYGQQVELPEIPTLPPRALPREKGLAYGKLLLNVGYEDRITPNHIVGAITERTGLSGREIGKIQIFERRSFVGIPQAAMEETVAALQSLKICGKPVSVSVVPSGGHARTSHRDRPFRGEDLPRRAKPQRKRPGWYGSRK